MVHKIHGSVCALVLGTRFDNVFDTAGKTQKNVENNIFVLINVNIQQWLTGRNSCCNS